MLENATAQPTLQPPTRRNKIPKRSKMNQAFIDADRTTPDGDIPEALLEIMKATMDIEEFSGEEAANGAAEIRAFVG